MVAISEDQEGEDSVYWIDAQAVINDISMGSVAAGSHDGAKLRMWAQLGQSSIAPAVPIEVNRPLVPGPFASSQQSERIGDTWENRAR